jgi:hypothetical protein
MRGRGGVGGWVVRRRLLEVDLACAKTRGQEVCEERKLE